MWAAHRPHSTIRKNARSVAGVGSEDLLQDIDRFVGEADEGLGIEANYQDGKSRHGEAGQKAGRHADRCGASAAGSKKIWRTTFR